MPEPWFDSGSVDELCDKIEEELSILLQKYRNLEYGDEDDLSSQFLTRVEAAVEKHDLKYLPPAHGYGSASGEAVRLHARRFEPAPKPKSRFVARRTTFRTHPGEEREYGADILFVFELGEGKDSKKKGLLIQCKDTRKLFKRFARRDLRDQCRKMAAVTDASYILFFMEEGFKFAKNNISTDQVEWGITADHLLELRDVLGEFFECTGGDESLNTARRGEFFTVAAGLVAKRALVVTTREPGEAEAPVGDR